jgi:branched-chain amino acid transport system substrate-binding protein
MRPGGRAAIFHANIAGPHVPGERTMSRTVRGRLLASLAMACTCLAQPAVAAEDIVLGNIASLSNPFSKTNVTNLLLGYTVYFEQINGQGGVHGRKVRILNKDDGIVAERMMQLTEELAADPGVLALVGFLNTPGMLDMIKQGTLVQKKIALIAPIGSMNAPNFYPLRAGYNDEVRKLLEEAVSTQKKRVALVYFNQTFGPGLYKFAEEAAKTVGANVVATAGFETAADKIEASVAETAERVSKAEPDAVIVMSSGPGVYAFTKKFRQTQSKYAQIYTMSTSDASSFVKSAGLENASGVVISQAVPYPEHNALAVVRDYHKVMKQYAPDQPLTFYGLEGFMGAKIAVEALRRAGPNPTRQKVITALNTMTDFDLGGFLVSYSPAERSGSKTVDLTIIGKNGVLFR